MDDILDTVIHQIQTRTEGLEFEFEEDFYFIRCDLIGRDNYFFIGLGKKSDFDFDVLKFTNVVVSHIYKKEMHSYCLTSKFELIQILRCLKVKEVIDG
jgi:hypothetical protein